MAAKTLATSTASRSLLPAELQAIAVATALLVGGCTKWPAVPGVVAPARSGLTIQVLPQVGRRSLQNLVHRWQAADIYQYDVRLKTWDGSSFVDLDPPLEVQLPQKGNAVSTIASFGALRQGRKYRAEVRAWGNAGGTAPTTLLNNQVLSYALWDFSAANDVPAQATTQVAPVILDQVPFSGKAIVAPTGFSTRTTSFKLTLADSDAGLTLLTTAFAAGTDLALEHLRAGTHYQFEIVAQDAIASELQFATGSLYFDPQASDLADEVTVPAEPSI